MVQLFRICIVTFALFFSIELTAQKTTFLLVDAKATLQTKALFLNLQKLSKTSILFGHQHATEYGHGWSDETDRSDVQSVVGSHPAVIGVDFSGLSGKPSSEVEATKKSLKNTIEATYQRGGVTTVSWHFNNPVTNTAFYWKDSVSAAAVPMIIPGGSYHESYKQILQNIASLVKSLHGKDGEAIPLIFRPFHEFDGDWFWWGAKHCTKQEFTTLWKFTVQYLRDSLQVHNLLYAFSPDNKFTTEAQYLERYPGNEWVDMVGVDNYGDWGRDGNYNLEEGIKKLSIVSNYALKNNKLAAFTETGLESIVKNDWYTSVLLQSLQSNSLQLAYVLVWRNDKNSPTHYYAPFPGHGSCADFIKFYQSPFTLFEKDLPNLYK